MVSNIGKSTLIKDAIALFLITLISGLALSFIYEITKSPIAEQQELKKLKANQSVFAEATSFEPDEKLMGIAQSINFTDLDAAYKGVTIDEISKALNDMNEFLGYNITVTTSNTYKSPITMVIGYSKDGVIKGIEMLALNETAGLGMNAEKPDFINQFLNKKVNKFEVTKTGATAENQIDAISGATITTKGVVYAVNAGIQYLQENATELGGDINE